MIIPSVCSMVKNLSLATPIKPDSKLTDGLVKYKIMPNISCKLNIIKVIRVQSTFLGELNVFEWSLIKTYIINKSKIHLRPECVCKSMLCIIYFLTNLSV